MPPEVEEECQAKTLASVLSKLTVAIGRGLSPGDVAALRRLDPRDPAHPAFWKVCAGWLEDSLPPEGPARAESERRWAAILAGMAMTSGLHDPRRHAGVALAEAGYSELRFVRLLRSRGDGLADELRAAARFLGSKAVPFDWRDLALLVLSEGREDEEDTRRHLARNYYQHQHSDQGDMA
jgi:CRISPR system Cascade subunit CasB